MKSLKSAKRYFLEFMNSVKTDVSAYSDLQRILYLPEIPLEFFKDLVIDVTEIFSKENTLLRVSSPVTVVGDIHGHILDIFRIIRACGSPQINRYVFLGDIVDRGEFSVECITLIYIMKVLWPNNVLIIRGNHEFSYMCGQSGFFDQLCEVYCSSELFKLVITSFSHIPLAALIDGETLCVHAGLSPATFSLSQIEELERPFDTFGDDSFVDGLLWSDPSDDLDYFEQSPRGAGYLFGEIATRDFLENNNIKRIVRGHECVADGFKLHFSGTVMTVFSASNYCDRIPNPASAVKFLADGNYKVKHFEPLRYLRRCQVRFGTEKLDILTPTLTSEVGSARQQNNSYKVTAPKVACTKTPRIRRPVIISKSRLPVLAPRI